jgi:hypothetical protein
MVTARAVELIIKWVLISLRFCTPPSRTGITRYVMLEVAVWAAVGAGEGLADGVAVDGATLGTGVGRCDGSGV